MACPAELNFSEITVQYFVILLRRKPPPLRVFIQNQKISLAFKKDKSLMFQGFSNLVIYFNSTTPSFVNSF